MDYIKVKILNPNTLELSGSKRLDFKTVVSESTGLISTKKVADFHYCKLTFYDSGLVIFTGSLHKMWNSINNVKAPNYDPNKSYTGYNGNDFPITEILEARAYLCELLLCTTEQMEFQNIEFGVNAQISFNPQLFIKGLLFHNGKLFEYKYNDHFTQAVHQRYFLKIYNKSNQYGMNTYTLRFETKIIKSEDLKELEIKTFADINAQTLDHAHKLLLQRLDQVVYYDYTISKEDLTDRQTNILERYSNPRYWIYELRKQNRSYHKSKLSDLIIKNSTNLKRQLEASITQKFSTINPLLESVKFVPINRKSKTSSTRKFVPINRKFENTKFVPINHSSIELISTNNPPQKQTPIPNKKKVSKPIKTQGQKTSSKPPSKKAVSKRQIKASNEPRLCKVTRLDISMQKADSILLSHTGLRYYHATDPTTFYRVLNKYLSRKWMNADFETQIKELAHNIRNRHHSCITRFSSNDLQNDLFRIAN